MVSIQDVKNLREMTGAGMMDCKKALAETEGDVELAVEWLRKKGISQAAKKNSRTASDGLLGVMVSGNKAAVIEVNSETDFVARNEQFQQLVKTILINAIANGNDLDSLNNSVLPNGQKVSDYVVDSIGTIGENIVIRRTASLEAQNGFISSYIHNAVDDSLGKIAVLIQVETSRADDEAKQFAKQVAMHIAAARPVALNSNEVDPTLIAKEKEIFSEQARASGKPENIIEKMVEGRIRKFYEEVVLLEQAFVLDGKTRVLDAIADFNKVNNSDFKITSFVRYELGEGVEKEESNFADEVNAMSASS